MNKKYERYIEYIVSDIEAPYFENMVEMYGLRPDEYELVLSKIYDQPVRIKGDRVYDTNGNYIYYEDSNGSWIKREYDANGNLTYREKDNGFWIKREYDANGNLTYKEDSNGFWIKKEYDDQGNKIYYEDSYGVIRDNR
tara:strand:+ start:1353 stop:1769 length:417 start_codon:yes stop_codon:yes gene_type:complete